MIPSEDQAKVLWDKYNLPPEKRRHVLLVAQVVRYLVKNFKEKGIDLNESLIIASALLHDIDKNASKLPGERHPDTAVRILQEECMEEVAEVVKTHPLHAILDPAISAKSWEEKILFFADKMVKYKVIDVDKRFELWKREQLPQQLLTKAYPKVKQLEKEIAKILNLLPSEVANEIQKSILGSIKTY